MLKKSLSLIMILTNCTPLSAAKPVVSAPSSLPSFGQMFAEIPSDRCSPALDGLFLSWEGADNLIMNRRRERADLLEKVASCEEQRDINASRQKTAEAEAERSKSWWTTVGIPLAVGIGAAILGGFIGYEVKK